ncbi:MAG TPA: HIT domain-containing protein [Mariprofundaceae bacterium]|nr:HIT domain-containing protein [Mariprofundaceae bacterium]
MLHPRLAGDCLRLGAFPLSELLLMNDARYPWYILVPRREGIREIFELAEADQQQLLHESSQLAQAMAGALAPDKLNIAAIGNIVPQLHVHHVARFRHDAAWPAPVWGIGTPEPYAGDAWRDAVASVLARLSPEFDPAPTEGF